MEKNYVIDHGTNKVSRTIVSKGEEFTATAVCNVTHKDGDIFNEEIGKAIVDYRLELMQRRRDLKLTKDFIAEMQKLNGDKLAEFGRKGTSKHYMLAIQNACEERDNQRDNIRYCVDKLESLTSGDYVQAILTLNADRRITPEQTSNFIREYYDR